LALGPAPFRDHPMTAAHGAELTDPTANLPFKVPSSNDRKALIVKWTGRGMSRVCVA
jgi:hypothetical protein